MELNVGDCVSRPAAYWGRLANDLERLLRHASTTKGIELPKDEAEAATAALQETRSLLNSEKPLTESTETSLLKAVDMLSWRVYPATITSLEIADIMEVGAQVDGERQITIRSRVTDLTRRWSSRSILALGIAFALIALSENKLPYLPQPEADLLMSSAKAAYPVTMGFLGACAYILRSILQGLANKTFVLRDEWTYTMRSVLGIILGYIIPQLLADKLGTGPENKVAIAFLAGYAVEPMFAGLDNLVLTIRDLVGRNQAGDQKHK